MCLCESMPMPMTTALCQVGPAVQGPVHHAPALAVPSVTALEKPGGAVSVLPPTYTMGIPFPPGVPSAHLIPEGSVGPICLVLRKAHSLGVVCVRTGTGIPAEPAQLHRPSLCVSDVRDMP